MRAIAVNGEAVGGIGLTLGAPGDVHRKTAELGYWLGEDYWGRGIMAEAISAICSYGFSHYGLLRIFAEPYATNTGSRRVLEKCGFVLEGILCNHVIKGGQVLDACMYARLPE